VSDNLLPIPEFSIAYHLTAHFKPVNTVYQNAIFVENTIVVTKFIKNHVFTVTNLPHSNITESKDHYSLLPGYVDHPDSDSPDGWVLCQDLVQPKLEQIPVMQLSPRSLL